MDFVCVNPEHTQGGCLFSQEDDDNLGLSLKSNPQPPPGGDVCGNEYIHPYVQLSDSNIDYLKTNNSRPHILPLYLTEKSLSKQVVLWHHMTQKTHFIPLRKWQNYVVFSTWCKEGLKSCYDMVGLKASRLIYDDTWR